jgi:hypothetical protein
MNNNQTFNIRFENVSAAEASQKASQLRAILLDLSPDASAEVIKDNQSTQDFGTVLVLVLGTPAVVIIAKGIADYLSRVGGTITIEDKNGKVIAKGIQSKDAARIAEAFSKKKKR